MDKVTKLLERRGNTRIPASKVLEGCKGLGADLIVVGRRRSGAIYVVSSMQGRDTEDYIAQQSMLRVAINQLEVRLRETRAMQRRARDNYNPVGFEKAGPLKLRTVSTKPLRISGKLPGKPVRKLRAASQRPRQASKKTKRLTNARIIAASR